MSHPTASSTEQPPTAAASRPFDVQRLRQDFPILARQVHGQELAYLDNAATTQKPQAVLDAERDYYTTMNSNIHRGVHTLSIEATQAHEHARRVVQRFINAASDKEIIFTRGTTEAINLIAQSYVRPMLQPRDEVLITHMEHHSNIVPWQIICEQAGAILRVAPVTDSGEVDMEQFKAMLSSRTRVVSVVHVSNTLGTVNPIERIIEAARQVDAAVVIDGAQATAHAAVDVQELDCDFYAISGHKMYAPTGIGVLYGKQSILERMQPYQGGGDMIRSVTFEKTTYNDLPYKFEAGTPNIAGAIGLRAAIDYINSVGLSAIASYETELLQYAEQALASVPGLKFIGTPAHRAGAISFTLEGMHPHDIGTVLDSEAVAIRTGHHCTQPLMERFGIPATARLSVALYNTREEVDRLVRGLHRAGELLGV